MAEKGQCSDPNLPRHHEHGIPLVAGIFVVVIFFSIDGRTYRDGNRGDCGRGC